MCKLIKYFCSVDGGMKTSNVKENSVGGENKTNLSDKIKTSKRMKGALLVQLFFVLITLKKSLFDSCLLIN